MFCRAFTGKAISYVHYYLYIVTQQMNLNNDQIKIQYGRNIYERGSYAQAIKRRYTPGWSLEAE